MDSKDFHTEPLVWLVKHKLHGGQPLAERVRAMRARRRWRSAPVAAVAEEQAEEAEAETPVPGGQSVEMEAAMELTSLGGHANRNAEQEVRVLRPEPVLEAEEANTQEQHDNTANSGEAARD